MLVLQNIYRNIFFMFLLINTPMCIFGDSFLQSQHLYQKTSDYEETNSEEIENRVLDQNSTRKDNLITTSKTKTCKKIKNDKRMTYFLYVADFIKSFIEIPSSNVLVDSSTISSTYLAGRAPIYVKPGKKVGTCSASFLCMQNADGIFTDISNYLSVDNGLIVSWFTPSTLINLELDSIVHSMVTEWIVKASTKIGFNPFYGKTYNMIVSSTDDRIYFQLTKI